MTQYEFLAQSEQETERLGAALAAAVPDGTTIALCGTLGAGKTRLVQALAEACGVPRRDVTSPTFMLCQHYRGRRTIHHLDAYRIGDDDEFLELGPDEYFQSPAITVVEWADRVERCLPDERMEIHVEVVGDQVRRFRIIAVGCRLQPVLAALPQQLEQSPDP